MRPSLRSSLVLLLTALLASCPLLQAQRVMENITRGLIALPNQEGKVFLSWRFLESDDAKASFNVYRRFGEGAEVRLNGAPIEGPTFFIDEHPDFKKDAYYTVRAVVDGRELAPNSPFHVEATDSPKPYLSIPICPPPGGTTPDGKAYTYTANDGSVADLDGDGQLDIVLKWTPTNARDNSQKGYTGNTFLDGYTLLGQRLWRIDLGPNIRSGAHYTQFMVYDLDGDKSAEIVCKTADGSVDGTCKVIGDAKADHRNPWGHVLKGPEYLTVFSGRTGAALATTDYIPGRHPSKMDPSPAELKSVWGDDYGNRPERYLACVAYLDGQNPSVVMCRGYYTRVTLAAWDWRDGKLTQRWFFDSDDGTPENKAYHGQGNHNLSVADVDGDGKDEIIYGSAVIDDDGKGLYSTGWGHADAMHVSDLVPENPGLEVFNIQERFSKEGMNMRDARTGKPLFRIPSAKADESGSDKGEGPGRGVAFNIDPRHPGAESWARGAGMNGMLNAKGERITNKQPRSCNFAVWWDGDLLRELLDGTRISKWNWETETDQVLLNAEGCDSNNGTKSNPVLSGDILGDWREEVIWRRADNQELRIYSTTIPTKHRIVTLLQDPQYRLALVWQNVAYNQPPHPSFYLDEAAPLPPKPVITHPAK